MKPSSNMYIGLMSGTSLDGLDIVAVEFDSDSNQPFSIINGDTYDYTKSLKLGLKKCRNLTGYDLKKLEDEFSLFSADAINTFLEENNINSTDIAAIGHHGHTVFHEPNKGLTLQLLNGSTVAAKTKITTVCDFRSLDVVLGGQGAPLVPIGDRDLFYEYDACMNLGGIANISFKQNKRMKAFDICPFNLVLNYYAKKLNKPYDDKGKVASEGKTIETVLKQLNHLEYYTSKPPKSLGIEWVEEQFLPLFKPFETKHSIKDLLATSVFHFVQQVSEVIQSQEIKKLLITGGGSFNTFFIEQLSSANPKTEIMIPSKEVIEYKEALIFAYLASLRLQNKVNVLAEVTGATNDSCSGAVYKHSF